MIDDREIDRQTYFFAPCFLATKYNYLGKEKRREKIHTYLYMEIMSEIGNNGSF